MDVLSFKLPYPPSVNHYYLHTTAGVVLSGRGRTYRRDVSFMLHKLKGAFSADKRLQLTIDVFPPDKRKRDIDNIAKCCLDSLQYAKVFNDDNQIDRLTIVRREVDIEKSGYLQIWISECS